MRRLGIAVAVVIVALGSFGVGSATAYLVPYTGPGEWFAPGQGRSSDYDWCGYWTENNFAKAPSAWGLTTFITPGGGWRYSKQKYGNIFNSLGSDYKWFKKLHCKNNTGSGYQGGCFGDRQSALCA